MDLYIPSKPPEGTTFEGYEWHLTLVEQSFRWLQEENIILPTVIMEILEVGCCDEKGHASKVAILVSHFRHVLRLLFCCPLHDILDLLGLEPA